MSNSKKKRRITELTQDQSERLQKGINLIDEVLNELYIPDSIERRRLSFMGDKTESFCRQTLIESERHPEIFPLSINIDRIKDAFSQYGQYSEMALKLESLSKQLNISVMVLGADIKSDTSQMYNHIGCYKHHGELLAAYQRLSSFHKKTKPPKPKNNSDTSDEKNDEIIKKDK